MEEGASLEGRVENREDECNGIGMEEKEGREEHMEGGRKDGKQQE